MNEWISVEEAGNLLGLSHNRVRERAHGGEWGFRIERVDSRHGSTRKMFVRADDVRLVAESGGRQKALAACAVSREGDVSLVQRLVDWADSLTQWPADDEITARVDGAYRFKDIESVLETRVHRGRSALEKRAVVCVGC